MILRQYFILVFFLTGVCPAFAGFTWGANGHPFTAYPGTSMEQQLKYLDDLGVKSYRVDIRSTDAISGLEKLLKMAKSHEIKILPVITPGAIDLAGDSEKVLYDKSYKLAHELGTRFKTEIRVWELGNELENYAIIQPCEMRDDGTQYPCEWGVASGIGVLDYYGPRWKKVSAVLKGLSDGMKSADPDIGKAIGTAGWQHVGAFERMQEDGIDWDISVWHLYDDDPQWAFEKIAKYGKPIWVTEFGKSGESTEGKTGDQAFAIVKMMARLRQLQDKYDVEAAHIYELMDEPHLDQEIERHFGLVSVVPSTDGGWRPDEPKSSYFAVRDVIRGHVPAVKPKRDCEYPTADIEKSVQFLQLEYSYCLVLGRQADGEGLAGWLKSLQTGKTTIVEILRSMLNSPEFHNKYPLYRVSNTDYIDFYYQLLLNRDPDPAEAAVYVKKFSSGEISRTRLAYYIVDSNEFEKANPLLFVTKDKPSPGNPGSRE